LIYIQGAERNKKQQSRILYPARLSFRRGEIRSFPDKQKLKEFITTISALQERLQVTLKVERKDHTLE